MDLDVYFNQTGGGSGSYGTNWGWTSGAATAVVGLGGAVAGIFEAKAQNKTNQAIAQQQFGTQQNITQAQLGAEQKIQAGHDLTAIEVAQIQAQAAMNTPVQPKSNAVVIGVFVFMIVATIGIFYAGTHKG